MDKVILRHETWNNSAYDILVKKSLLEKYYYLKEEGYSCDCDIAQNFIKKNPDFVHLCSDDLNHIESMNGYVKKWIKGLQELGFKIVRVPKVSGGQE